MINGSLWDKILLFALPLAASSILQQLFNAADTAIVGRFAGKLAMAAVGSNSSIINFLINFFIGMSVGVNVVAARFYALGKKDKVSQVAHTALLLSVISGIVVMVIGVLVARPVLQLVGSPHDIIDMATTYLRIYFLGAPFIMVYNFGSAVLRSKGDTKRPFICLLIAGITNLLLNILFVVGFGMDADGVAIATVISNVVSAGMILFFLAREEDLALSFKKLKIYTSLLKDILWIGIPTSIQSMAFSFSNICMQSGINSLGSLVVAGSVAAQNLENIVYLLMNAFCQACITFVGQNYAIKNYKRCDRILVLCFGMGCSAACIMSFAFLIFHNFFLSFFTTDPQVMEMAFIRMRVLLFVYLLCGIMDTFTAALRGMGRSIFPMLISVIGVCGIRLAWVFAVFPHFRTFGMLLLVYPLSWGLAVAALVVTYLLIRRKLNKAV